MIKKLSLVLTIGLTGYIIFYIIRNSDQFKVLGTINPVCLAAMLLVFYAVLLAAAYRMLEVMKRFGLESIGYWHWFRVFIIARFLSKLIPQGGNVYRAYTLKKETGFPLKKYTLGFVVFTWIDLMLTILFAGLSAVLFQPRLTMWSFPVPYLAAIALIVMGAVIFLFIWLSRKMVPGTGRLKEYAIRAGSIVQKNLNVHFLAAHSLMGAVYFLLLIGWFYLGFLSLDIRLGFGTLALFTALNRIGTITSITPGNLGILEIAFGILAVSTGMDFSKGILIGAVSRACGFSFTLLFGAIHGGIPMIKTIRKKTLETNDIGMDSGINESQIIRQSPKKQP